MGKYDKKYEAMKLFVQQSQQKDREQSRTQQAGPAISGRPSDSHISMQDGMYYEIEYDATPMPGVGKFVLKSQKIETPERDEIRERFDSMRDIARRNRVPVYGRSNFYNKKVQQERARIFYKQGQFMKDFQDEYGEMAPYSEYFPCYQMMGYRQLRTYFTWRTKVRQGQVEDTSLSYAYVYLYELLNNIGVADPQEGLERLLAFWKEIRVYHPAVDKHVPGWLKDYYIYYEQQQTFQKFVAGNGLADYYPELAEEGEVLDLYCGISRYDIRKSKFYNEDRQGLIQDCFQFTFQRLALIFAEHGIELESMIFPPTKSMSIWVPFQDALFYPWLVQRDRRVVISPKEVYVCSQSQWFYQKNIAAESGRQLLGYILKQMESVLRGLEKYKYKITAGISSVNQATVERLEAAGISLEQCVTDAVKEFYREATRTVVTVNRAALEKIRQEAQLTQERLLVPEEDGVLMPSAQGVFTQTLQSEPAQMNCRKQGTVPLNIALEQEPGAFAADLKHKTMPLTVALEQEPVAFEADFEQVTIPLEQESAAFTADLKPGMTPYTAASGQEPAALPPGSERELADPWFELKDALTQTQREALLLALQGNANIKEFADAHGIMLEILADGINEKAVDIVGDSLLDEEFAIYSDYVEQVKELLKE